MPLTFSLDSVWSVTFPRCVHSLNLTSSLKVGDDGVASLAAALLPNEQGQTQLKKLYLNGNAFGDDGAVALAEVLSRADVRVTDVNLGYSNPGIGDRGAAYSAHRTCRGAPQHSTSWLRPHCVVFKIHSPVDSRHLRGSFGPWRADCFQGRKAPWRPTVDDC